MKTTLDLMTDSQLRDLWESGKHPFKGYLNQTRDMADHMDDKLDERIKNPPVDHSGGSGEKLDRCE